MENDREQLKNRFMATSRPASSSSDFARRQCETYQRTDKGFLVSENNTCHIDVLTTYINADGMLMVADSCGSPAVKSSADKGALNSVPDYFGSGSVISKEGKVLSNTCHDDGSTASGGSQEDKVQRASMESLPADILQDILSRIPAESVLECKLVCKTWETLLRRSDFTNMHLSRQLNHLYDGDDSNDNLAATVEPCLFFACRTDDPDEFITLLFHGGQLSDGISIDEKYIYNQNLKRIYHPPMHNQLLYDHLVGSCNGLVCTLQIHHLVVDPTYICNPLTREYVYLPQLVVNIEDVDPDYPDRIVGGVVDMRGDIA
ncbi:hypothetical protein MKX03_003557, partial [Papaver bracteatum]